MKAFFDIKKPDSEYQFAQFPISIIPRIKLWGLLRDMMTDTAKISPATFIRYHLDGATDKAHELCVRFELIRFLFSID